MTATITSEKTSRIDADTPWKNILDVYFRDFMELCLPALAANIDWSRNYDCLDKELNIITRGAKLGRCLADKLMKVWLKNGEETWILLHLEVQGYQDKYFPKRIFIYNYRLSDHYQVPIISIAILTDGNPAWRPHQYRQGMFGCTIEMNFLVIKVLDFAAKRHELEMMNNPFALVLLAQLTILETPKNPHAKLLTKISLTRRLYKHGFGKADIFQLYTFIDWLLVLPKPLMLEYQQAVHRIEEEQPMARFITTAERVGMWKGKEEGLQEGLRQGQEVVVEMFMRALYRRFNTVPPVVIAKIQQAKIKTLLKWEEKISTANAIEDIFT